MFRLVLLSLVLTCRLLFSTEPSWATVDAGLDFEHLVSNQTVTGEPFRLDRGKQFYVLIFLGVECPVARQYGAKLQSLADQFQNQPVQFVGVNSNPQDSRSEFAQYQTDFRIRFGMLKDSSQQLAKHFKVSRTAEAVLTNHSGEVLYQGRIDDQYTPGVARGKTMSHDLRNAIEAAVSGQPIEIPRTPPVGCLITYKRAPTAEATVTFTKNVAPLLWSNCYECHRSGEIGPFDVSDYEDLQGWAEMSVEVMQQKRMPPWHANPAHGSFRNERWLPDGIIDTLKQWIDQGMPYGNPADLPPTPKFVDGWRLPKEPNAIVEMRSRPYRVPAEGVVDYQYFVVDPGFTEDQWVSASQIVPGEAKVVHHAIVFVRPPDISEFAGIGWLNAYVPGQQPVIYPPGYARKIPAGSKLVFQMHYTPSGTESFDVTKIGLNFVEADQVTHQVFTTIAIDQDFEIPPHAENHVVEALMKRVPQNAELLAISPHMHLRGKAFQVVGKCKNLDQVLLDVPNYDFNWQHTYELRQPLSMSQVDEIKIMASFDNSEDNPFNPNPNEYVMWGDQTFEEMTLGYFDVAIPMQDAQTPQQRRKNLSVALQVGRDHSVSLSAQHVAEFVESTLRRFDSNRDGIISWDETSSVFRNYGFVVVDQNHDARITRDELEAAARGDRGG